MIVAWISLVLLFSSSVSCSTQTSIEDCLFCRAIVTATEYYLAQNATQQEVLGFLLDDACSVEPWVSETTVIHSLKKNQLTR
jgi:hypothetical protein